MPPLSGNELNNVLAMGGLVGKNLKGLGMALNVPSDLSWATGVKDSVSKQFHRVNITPDAKKGDLSVAAAAGGAGYWVPYLGNGANNAPVGAGQFQRNTLPNN